MSVSESVCESVNFKYIEMLTHLKMLKEEVGPEFPGEGAILTSYSRVFSQARFWKHTKKIKKRKIKCQSGT